MRAVLFIGGDQPDPNSCSPYIGNVDIVVAADSGFDGARRSGFSVDYVIGDMDSISDPKVLEEFDDSRVIRWPRDKDYTDTECALEYLSGKGITDIVLVGGTGGRLDHLYAIQHLFTRPVCPWLWVGSETVVVPVGAGCAGNSIRLEGLRVDNPVSVFPASNAPLAVTSRGLHWELDSLDWSSGAYSLSNRSVASQAVISVTQGRFLVMFPLYPSITLVWEG